MKTSYLKFKVWVEADNEQERVKITLSEIMPTERLIMILDRLNFPGGIYRKKTYNFPLTNKEAEYIELAEGIRFGEFKYNRFLFFKRIPTISRSMARTYKTRTNEKENAIA